MEITKLDSPDDDGLFDELARLLRRVDDLLDRMHAGEPVPRTAVESVKREVVRLTLKQNPERFRPFFALPPANLN